MKKKTLVLGASIKPYRYSYHAVSKLIESNIEVVAHGSTKGEVQGVKINDSLQYYDDIDTITLYLNPTNQISFYNYIISLKPRRVIFNPGSENPEFYSLLKKNNIKVEEACTLVLLSTNQY